jgi:hypothetical protein
MIEVTIHNRNAHEIMEIVNELRQTGLVQGVDFDFAFHQSTWDSMIGEIPTNTVFKFYKDKYATFFSIRYSS